MTCVHDLAVLRVDEARLRAIASKQRMGTPTERALAVDLLRARSLLLRMAVQLERRSWRRRYPVGAAVEVLLQSGWASAVVVENADGKLRVKLGVTGQLYLVLLSWDIRLPGEDAVDAASDGQCLVLEILPDQQFEFVQHLDAHHWYYNPLGWIGEAPFSEPFDTLEEAHLAADAELRSVREATAKAPETFVCRGAWRIHLHFESEAPAARERAALQALADQFDPEKHTVADLQAFFAARGLRYDLSILDRKVILRRP